MVDRGTEIMPENKAEKDARLASEYRALLAELVVRSLELLDWDYHERDAEEFLKRVQDALREK